MNKEAAAPPLTKDPGDRNFAGPLEDKIAIRELNDTYGDAITRRDVDLWAGCWAMNGRWKPGAEVFVGRDRIVEHWITIMKGGYGVKGSHSRLFLAHPGAIVVSGSEGSGWAYTTELLVDDQHMTYHMNGLYSDRFIREEGRWVFLERSFMKLHIDRAY